jgi:RHS repeat-associated protein
MTNLVRNTQFVLSLNEWKPSNAEQSSVSFSSFRWQGIGAYRYGFNGKEKDNENFEGAYDFGARILDVRLGRWLSVDPLADKYPKISPYSFVANEPITKIDPEGEDIKPGNQYTANMFVDMLCQALGGVTERQALRIFNLDTTTPSFQYDDNNAMTNPNPRTKQPVFSVDNSARTVRKFNNAIDRRIRKNQMSPNQAIEARALFNLLSEPQTTELIIVSQGQLTSSATAIGQTEENNKTNNPNAMTIISVTDNPQYDALKQQIRSTNPSAIASSNAGQQYNDAQLSSRDNPLATGNSGFYPDSGNNTNANFRGTLIIDASKPLSTAKYSSGPAPAMSSKDLNNIALQGISRFENKLNSGAINNTQPYKRNATRKQ